MVGDASRVNVKFSSLVQSVGRSMYRFIPRGSKYQIVVTFMGFGTRVLEFLGTWTLWDLERQIPSTQGPSIKFSTYNNNSIVGIVVVVVKKMTVMMRKSQSRSFDSW